MKGRENVVRLEIDIWEGVSGWRTHVHPWQFMLTYGKTNTIL